jgi:hypothetical protein
VTGTGPDGGLAAALLQLADHAGQLRELRDAIEVLQKAVDALTDPGGSGGPYQPVPAPRWWLLDGEDRTAAIARLAGWVEVVYRPSYGHLAARLPACWQQHPLCLFMLDWLSELHASLYLQPRRTPPMLSGQAEWQARLLPAAADAMAAEAAACAHRRNRP